MGGHRGRRGAVFLLVAAVLLASCGEGAPPDAREQGVPWDGGPRRVRLSERQNPELVVVGDRIVALGGYQGDVTDGRLHPDGVLIDAATGGLTKLPEVPFEGEPVVIDAEALPEGRVVVAATVCSERPSLEGSHTSCPEVSIETAVLDLDRLEWSKIDLPDVPDQREVVPDGIFPRVELIAAAHGGAMHLLITDVDEGTVDLHRLDSNESWAAVPPPGVNDQVCAVDATTLYALGSEWVGGASARPGLDPPYSQTLRQFDGEVWIATSYTNVLGPADGTSPAFECDPEGPVLMSSEGLLPGTGGVQPVVFQRLPNGSEVATVDWERPALLGSGGAVGSSAGVLAFAGSGDVAWLRPDGTAALVPRFLEREGIEPSWDGESGLLAVEELSAPVPEGEPGDRSATIVYLRLGAER